MSRSTERFAQELEAIAEGMLESKLHPRVVLAEQLLGHARALAACAKADASGQPGSEFEAIQKALGGAGGNWMHGWNAGADWASSYVKARAKTLSGKRAQASLAEPVAVVVRGIERAFAEIAVEIQEEARVRRRELDPVKSRSPQDLRDLTREELENLVTDLVAHNRNHIRHGMGADDLLCSSPGDESGCQGGSGQSRWSGIKVSMAGVVL